MKLQYGLLVFGAVAVSPLAGAPRAVAPIIDVHVHAFQPDRFGPPGQLMCQPYEYWPARDPAEPMSKYVDDWSGHPDCKRKLEAPRTADEIVNALSQS